MLNLVSVYDALAYTGTDRPSSGIMDKQIQDRRSSVKVFIYVQFKGAAVTLVARAALRVNRAALRVDRAPLRVDLAPLRVDLAPPRVDLAPLRVDLASLDRLRPRRCRKHLPSFRAVILIDPAYASQSRWFLSAALASQHRQLNGTGGTTTVPAAIPKHAVSVGAIVGIVLGLILALAGIGLLLLYLRRRDSAPADISLPRQIIPFPWNLHPQASLLNHPR
ncbi:hypothetical protein B0H19DRAFT_1277338 [Mycena capillaripes]|nr:hypothetical protein B0H19DRAFT_1277338 [Mycena capillaripes]